MYWAHFSAHISLVSEANLRLILTTDYIYNGTLPALKSLLTLLTKIPQHLQKLAPQAIPPLLHTPPSPLPPLVHSLEKPQTAPHSGEQPGVPPRRNWAPVPGPREHINVWSVCLLTWLMDAHYKHQHQPEQQLDRQHTNMLPQVSKVCAFLLSIPPRGRQEQSAHL